MHDLRAMSIIFSRCLILASTILLLWLRFLGSGSDPGKEGKMLSVPRNINSTNLPVYCPCLQLNLFLLFLSELSGSISVYNCEFLFTVWCTPLMTAICMALPVEWVRQGSHCPLWNWQWHPSTILVMLTCSVTPVSSFLHSNHDKLLINKGLTLITYSAWIRVPCPRFSNAWAISHYGISHEQIWSPFLSKIKVPYQLCWNELRMLRCCVCQ